MIERSIGWLNLIRSIVYYFVDASDRSAWPLRKEDVGRAQSRGVKKTSRKDSTGEDGAQIAKKRERSTVNVASRNTPKKPV